MKVTVFNEQDDLSISKRSVSPIVKSVLALENQKTDEVIIHFVSLEKISSLHEEFFDDPSPTDCITFPLENDSIPHILGEIFICPKVALDYVENKQEAAYTEATLYLIHGLLHLIGYDDIDPSDRRRMQRVQNKHLEKVRSQNLLLY